VPAALALAWAAVLAPAPAHADGVPEGPGPVYETPDPKYGLTFFGHRPAGQGSQCALTYEPPSAQQANHAWHSAIGADRAWRKRIAETAQANKLDPALLEVMLSLDPGPRPTPQVLQARAQRLRTLLDRFGGDLRVAVAAEHVGEAVVLGYGGRVPPFPETIRRADEAVRRYLGPLPTDQVPC
jgi:soluble lytic murein transglycosylase-like protein